MNRNEAALSVSGLRRAFPMGRGVPDLVAVDDVSFELAPGGSLGVVGESGSGKSTVARMLVGLERPDSGEIRVAGRARGVRERGRAARLRRAREIQLVFQNPLESLDRRLTAAQCLHHVLRLHGADRAEADRRALELLEQVGLGAREAEARPHRLSGGQRQRLAIARALAAGPSVLVLDEAVSALDVSVQAQILRLLARIREESGVSLVFVSHDLAVVGQVTDEVLVMYRGRAVEHGPTRRVLREPEHPYTRMLASSVPRPGWDPAEVVRLRAEFAATAQA
ncbi:ATP-binding cassette domain-containing protein [Nocardiopsis alba]|uniref:ATP-binding cassette domain-containing protein n=1 Tax=Nocardiopsis alba TaxID=53437 RepID=A0ABV5DPK5_9ACTN